MLHKCLLLKFKIRITEKSNKCWHDRRDSGSLWHSPHFPFPFLAPCIDVGIQGCPGLWLQLNKVLHKQLCPSIPPTQSLCLHLPRAPCPPAETNSASSCCRASVPGICARSASCFHALTGMSSQPISRRHLQPLLAEGFPDLLHKLITSFVSAG